MRMKLYEEQYQPATISTSWITAVNLEIMTIQLKISATGTVFESKTS